MNPSEIVEAPQKYKYHDVNGQYIVFKKKENGDFMHLAIKMKDQTYYIDEISMSQNAPYDADMIFYYPISFLGKDIVEVRGIMGANYSPTLFIAIESSKPEILLKTEGPVFHYDFDKDGTKEVVSSYGTAAQTDFFKYVDGQFLKVNINDALGAEAVHFNEGTGIFEAYLKNKETHKYEYTKNGLKQIDQ